MRKRREADPQGQDTGVVDRMMSLVAMTQSIPFFGGYIIFVKNWLGETVDVILDFDNGMIARVLGGTLPCEIDIDTGVTCTGVTDKNNVAHLILALLDQSPLPTMVKGGIYSVMSYTLEPTMDAIFGGVALNNA